MEITKLTKATLRHYNIEFNGHPACDTCSTASWQNDED